MKYSNTNITFLSGFAKDPSFLQLNSLCKADRQVSKFLPFTTFIFATHNTHNKMNILPNSYWLRVIFDGIWVPSSKFIQMITQTYISRIPCQETHNLHSFFTMNRSGV